MARDREKEEANPEEGRRAQRNLRSQCERLDSCQWTRSEGRALCGAGLRMLDAGRRRLCRAPGVTRAPRKT